MRLTLRHVTRLSREIAAEYLELVEVEGVANSTGGSDYVELLLTVRGSGSARTVLVDARRTSAADLEVDLRRRITKAMKAAAN